MNPSSIRQMKKNTVLVIMMSFAIVLISGCAPTLYSAVEDGNIEQVRAMLKAGANVNETFDSFGSTALREAVTNRRSNIVRILLDAGADVNSRDYWGDTPLFWAAYYGPIESVKLLLDKGADVNSTDNQGTTPLMSAAEGIHADIIKLLISKGADIDSAIAASEAKAAQDPASVWVAAEKILARFAPKQEAGQTAPAINTSNNEGPKTSLISDVDRPAYKIPENADKFAVVVGIEKYSDLPEASYAEKDASIMRDHLIAMGFPLRNIILLTGQKATRSGISKNLETWLPNNTNKNSTVFFYYSGHGAPDPSTGAAYIVPFDGDPNYLGETGYSLSRLYQKLGELKVRKVVIVLDSCFSGAGGKSVLAKGARPLVMTMQSKPISPNMVVLSATQGSQISTSSPVKGHGLLTYYYLKALNEGNVEMDEIYNYLKPRVEDEARSLNVNQSPSLQRGF